MKRWIYLIGMVTMIFWAKSVAAQEDSVRQRLVFFGDSITQLGDGEGGFVSIIRDSLSREYPNIEVLGKGISGNKVTDLMARVDRDVLKWKPSWVVIYIGINDVWHWTKPNRRGTTIDSFEVVLKDLVGKIQSAGSKVVVCTPSVIGEKVGGANPQDSMLDAYSDVSRKVALETGSELLDLRKEFTLYLSAHNPEDRDRSVLTVDGVHLNREGNKFVAELMLNRLIPMFGEIRH